MISLRTEMGKRSSSIRGRICISTPAETDEQPQWVSPAYGFSFNNSAVAAKLDACRALKNSYHNGLMCGYLDSEEALPEFLEKLEQAGIQEILQAKQSALDNWLNASH